MRVRRKRERRAWRAPARGAASQVPARAAPRERAVCSVQCQVPLDHLLVTSLPRVLTYIGAALCAGLFAPHGKQSRGVDATRRWGVRRRRRGASVLLTTLGALRQGRAMSVPPAARAARAAASLAPRACARRSGRVLRRMTPSAAAGAPARQAVPLLGAEDARQAMLAACDAAAAEDEGAAATARAFYSSLTGGACARGDDSALERVTLDGLSHHRRALATRLDTSARSRADVRAPAAPRL